MVQNFDNVTYGMKLEGWTKNAIYGIKLLELPKKVENSTFGTFDQNFVYGMTYDIVRVTIFFTYGMKVGV